MPLKVTPGVLDWVRFVRGAASLVGSPLFRRVPDAAAAAVLVGVAGAEVALEASDGAASRCFNCFGGCGDCRCEPCVDVSVYPYAAWRFRYVITIGDYATPGSTLERKILDRTVQTLSTNGISGSRQISGLVFVPNLATEDPCSEITAQFVPKSVTRHKDDLTFGYPRLGSPHGGLWIAPTRYCLPRGRQRQME
ncbi:uncharacterized protein N7496_011154 [Penicillium cataractarum]|uniref:Uncharacterized protein n=1 Tax=Penicillium cataractarum TaxID=2100454 RepID=A0A9W9REK8_9EURO|nr:uncharacterized protein N7496_011154 [Penicillium cataractarum]KAJ5358741.1 hypothetical protein N7496_011154 [Penicillium cataractarum]